MTNRSRFLVGHGVRGLVGLTREEAYGSHSLCVGATGAGKSAKGHCDTFQYLDDPSIHIISIDCKGESSQDLLSTFLPARWEMGIGPSPDQVAAPSTWRDGSMVPGNILARVPGTPIDIQAGLTVSLFKKHIGDDLGIRMLSIFEHVVPGVIELGGTLLDVLRVTEDERAAAWVGQRISNPEIAHYLLFILHKEPVASRAALCARLRHVMNLRHLRAALITPSCVSGLDLIRHRLVVINAADGPPEHREISRWQAAIRLRSIIDAIENRPEGLRDRRFIILFDEFHVLVDSHEDLERLLTQIRWKGASVHLFTQSLDQIRDDRLVKTALANIQLFFAFSPEGSDLQRFKDFLPVTGTMVDPRRPDRLLTLAEEREVAIQTLRRLPKRHMWFVNRNRGGESQIVRTLELPYQRAREIVTRLPESKKTTFWRGKIGKRMDELEAMALPPLVPTLPHEIPPISGQRHRLDDLGADREDVLPADRAPDVPPAPQAAPELPPEGDTVPAETRSKTNKGSRRGRRNIRMELP